MINIDKRMPLWIQQNQKAMFGTGQHNDEWKFPREQFQKTSRKLKKSQSLAYGIGALLIQSRTVDGQQELNEMFFKCQDLLGEWI
jgi:hypothetical protein